MSANLIARRSAQGQQRKSSIGHENAEWFLCEGAPVGSVMQFVLALLAFRYLTGKTGIVRMSEVIRTQGIAPKSGIINELFEAGIMGQRNDGIVVYHPIIQAMMTPLPASPCDNESGMSKVIALPVNKRGAA